MPKCTRLISQLLLVIATAFSLAFDVEYYCTRSRPGTAAALPKGGSVANFVTVMIFLRDGSWKILHNGYNPAMIHAFDEVAAIYIPASGTEITN